MWRCDSFFFYAFAFAFNFQKADMDLLADYGDFVARKINNMYADADVMSQSNIFRRNFYVSCPCGLCMREMDNYVAWILDAAECLVNKSAAKATENVKIRPFVCRSMCAEAADTQ